MAFARKSSAPLTETVSLSNQAYQKILTGLFNRTVPAGAFLSQRDLTEMLDVPIQPLRDALKVLEAEGIVKVHPRSGIQFVKADIEFVHNTYQFRAIIERAAARRFAETGNMKEIRALIKDHEEIRAEVEKGAFTNRQLAKLGTLDQKLHSTMLDSMNNPLIQSAAQRLQNYVKLIQLENAMTRPYALRTIDEHLKILRACAERDADAAETLLSAHFQSALGRVLGSL